MKRTRALLMIIALSSIILNCDPPRYYDYFIINKCDEDIEIRIEMDSRYNSAIYGYDTEVLHLQVASNTTELMTFSEYWQPLTDDMVELFFEEIIVTKGSDTSKINYVDKDLWEFKITSQGHADNYLTVNPDDFE